MKMSQEDFANAYRRGFKLTIRFLISRGVPSDVAEETAQAAWVRGWERLYQLRDQSLLLTWANSIAINLYRTRAASEKRTGPLLSESTHVRNTDTNAMDARKILSLCRSGDRRLLSWYYIDGRGTAEIADQEGLSETAVRIRLMRARRYAQQQATSLPTPQASAA